VTGMFKRTWKNHCKCAWKKSDQKGSKGQKGDRLKKKKSDGFRIKTRGKKKGKNRQSGRPGHKNKYKKKNVPGSPQLKGPEAGHEFTKNVVFRTAKG